MKILATVAVLPCADIPLAVEWYVRKLGFQKTHADGFYAVLRREGFYVHLQWHADSPEDPLLGGSVLKIFVSDVAAYYAELRERGCDIHGELRRNTSWGTHEFGLYDPDRNAIFFVEDAT